MPQPHENDTNSDSNLNFIPLDFKKYSANQMQERLNVFAVSMLQRRTGRDFSKRPVSRAVIEQCLRVAGSGPSGVNMQPWHFVVASNGITKRQIRTDAEKEEREFYQRRASPAWLKAVQSLGTNKNKPFLEQAPCLIVVFAQSCNVLPGGTRVKNYYVNESVGIATGLLITAIHLSGLVSLTHTPSPMRFLNKILNRPSHERPFLILVIGYPRKNATVPQLPKKKLGEFATFE